MTVQYVNSVIRIPFLIFFCIIGLTSRAGAQQEVSEFLKQALEMSIEELLTIDVVTPSMLSEELRLAPATVYVITEHDIISNGYYDLREALENVPGVTPINLDFFAFGGQRGFLGNFSQTLLLINGREVQNLIAAETFISNQFSTHNIKQIEIINGPGSSLYGANALVGVINIVTKSDSEDYDKIELQAEVGTERTRAFNIVFGKRFGDLRISGSARLYESDGWDFSDFVADSTRFSEGFPDLARGRIDSENRYLNQARAVPVSLKIEYKDFYAGRESYVNKANKGIERVALDFNGQRDYRRFEMHYLGWDKRFGDIHHLNVEYQHFKEWMWGINFQYKDALWENLRTENPLRNTTDPLTQQEIHRYFMDVYSQENSEGSSRNRLTVQLNSQLSEQLSTIAGYTYDDFDILGIVHSYDDLFPLNEDWKPSSRSIKNSAYLQAKQALFYRKLHLTLGGRFDHHSIYGDVWTFRSGFVYRPTERTYLKVLFGQAFREPNIFELDRNADLKPARINTFETSLLQRFHPNLEGNITLFRSDATDFITPSTTFVFINSEEVKTIWGVESQLFFRSGRVSGDIRYAYANPEDEDFAGESYLALNVYQHRVSMGVNYDVSRYVRLNTRINYYDAITAKHGNAVVDETIDLDAFTKVNLTASIHGFSYEGTRITLQATVKNLFDGTFYQPNVRCGGPKQFLQPGRQFQGRIILEF